MSFDFDSGQAKPEWLQNCLESAGMQVEVLGALQFPLESHTATLSKVEIQLANEQPVEAFLKVMQPPFYQDGVNEVRFYQQAHQHGLLLPVPRYFGSTVDESRQGSALLIEALQGNYIEHDWSNRKQPDLGKIRRLVLGLAKLHAATWGMGDTWGRPGYNREIAETASAAVDFPALLDGFVPKTEDLVDLRAQQALRQFVPVFVERMLDYLDTGPVMSLIHGDVHFGNVLVPVELSADVIFVDWANWAIDQPSDDLAHAIVSQVPPDFSAMQADNLITVYLDELGRCGISYPINEFTRDFQFALARQLIRPVIISELVPSIDDDVWQEMLVNIFAGIDQYDVWSLLE